MSHDSSRLTEAEWEALEVKYSVETIGPVSYFFFHVLQAWHKFVTKVFIKQVVSEREASSSDKASSGGKIISKLRWSYPLRILPFFNFIYDLFLDDSSPSPEGVKNLLDILGLLNALLLGAVVSVFTCVGFADLSDADARFTADPTSGYGKFWATPGSLNTSPYDLKKVIPPSAALENFASKAVSLFFLDIFLIVYTYADGLSKLGAKDDEKDTSTPQSDEDAMFDAANHKEMLFNAWWGYSKWAIMLCVFCTGAGCMYSVLSCGILFLIKYPDAYILARGTSDATAPDCPTGQQNSFFATLFSIVAVVVIGACGMGTARRYSAEDDLRERAVFYKIAKKQDEKIAVAEPEALPSLRLELVKILIQWAHLSIACDEWADFKTILDRLKAVRPHLTGKARGGLEAFYQLIHRNGSIKYGLELHESDDERFDKRVQTLISDAQYLPKEYEVTGKADALRGSSKARVAPVDVEKH